MSFLWLVVILFRNFSRSSYENEADLFRNEVLYPKNENLVNGSSSSSVQTQPSKLPQESSTQHLSNGEFQPVQPSGIQPKLLDTEELRARLQWKTQNQVGWRELNWWWIKRQRLDNGQQPQYKLKWVHRRWYQQPQQPLNLQQYYRWRHQKPISNPQVQAQANASRQNPISQENGDRILDKSQQNQEGDVKIGLQDKLKVGEKITSRTPNGMANPDGQLAQEKQNSASVEQNMQKLQNSFEKSHNQTSIQPNMQNSEKQNKVLRQTNVRNNQENLHTVEQQQPKISTIFPPEAESASSSESYWRNKELYPMWKPPIPGFGIFPVEDRHAGGTVQLRRHGNVKPLVAQSSSDKKFQTLHNSNVQQETWVIGLNLHYKKIRKNIRFPDQSKAVSANRYQQTNSILQGKEKKPNQLSTIENDPSNQNDSNWKSNSTISNQSNSSKYSSLPMTQQVKNNEKLHGENHQKYENKTNPDTMKNQVKGGNVTAKDAALVGQDAKSQGLSTSSNNTDVHQKNNLQMPGSHQKKIYANNKFPEKSIQSGSPALLQIPMSKLNTTETRSKQEPVQVQKGQIAPPPSSTVPLSNSFDNQPSIILKPDFGTTDISAQTVEEPMNSSEGNAEVESEEIIEFGFYVNKIGPKSTNESHFNSQEQNQSSISTNRSTSRLVHHNLNASTNPIFTVLRKPHIEEENMSHAKNSSSNQQLPEQELSSSNADLNHKTLNQSAFTDGNQLGRRHQLRLFDERNLIHSLEKRTIDSRGNSPKETDNQRLSNMESLGGPINIDPYDASLQNQYPSKGSVDMELSSNEVEYLFQAISSGMKFLINKIVGNAK